MIKLTLFLTQEHFMCLSILSVQQKRLMKNE